MPKTNPGPVWIALSVFGVIFCGLFGLVAGAVLFPREIQVEKPVEVQVEKVVEKIVEKPVEKVVEKVVVAPAPPFTYKLPDGVAKSATEDEAKVALMMRDDIRVATAAKEMAYHVGAIMPTSKKVKVLITPDAKSEANTSLEELRRVVVSALSGRGYVVLADDSSDQEWNTLIHVDVELVSAAGSMACVARADIRQGMVAFSNGKWRKVNVIVATFPGSEIPFKGSLSQVVKGRMAELVEGLAKADAGR